MLCPVNRALHSTDHLTPHSLSSSSAPHSLSAPSHLSSYSLLYYLFIHGWAQCRTWKFLRRNVYCSSRTSSRGTVGRENTLHQCHPTSYHKNKSGYKDEISYLGGRYYLQRSRSTIGHKNLKVHLLPYS